MTAAGFGGYGLDTVFRIFELVGIVASAVSGSLKGIKHRMDLFGVAVLAIITALGGGLIRDIVIGSVPPAMFKNPLYVSAATAVSFIVFVIAYITYGKGDEKYPKAEEWMLFISDTIGLAAYTVTGIEAAVRVGQTGFGLLLFVGVITGTGGGMLRDIICRQIPSIFKKHVYALASAAGAVACVVMLRSPLPDLAMPVGFAVIIIIRVLAKSFKWNMPVVGGKGKGIPECRDSIEPADSAESTDSTDADVCVDGDRQ